MSNRLLVTAATGYSGRYPTRTPGEAHLYRVIQYYDCWPFEPSSRVPAGSASRQRTETFRTLSRSGSGSPAPTSTHATSTATAGTGRLVAVAEQLTGHGWQPLDLDVLPPHPAARRRRAARPRHGAAPAGGARPGKDAPR